MAHILHDREWMSLQGLVDPAQQEVLREERRILSDLRTSLVRFGASDENVAPLERSIEQLDELFLLVVVGEFNAGKSAFINALAGQRLMEEGATPTTAHVTPVRIDDINIVDTPGTNAIIRAHEQITSDFVPRADLVLFVTSADRPFTETERLSALRADLALLDDVESQLGLFQQDMTREFEGRMATVDNVLLEMERRGHDFLDDTIRIGRMVDLLNRSRVQEGFERQVVADAPQQIEKRVNDLVDWLVESDYRQWQRISRHLADRRREFRERIVGDDHGDPESRPFHDERRRLVESVGSAAQRVVETYDRRQEASELADGARNAVAAAAAAGAGAVGLGTLVAFA